jgi:hypothetical protein
MSMRNSWFVLSLISIACFTLVKIDHAIADSSPGNSGLCAVSLADSRSAPKSFTRSTLECDPCTFEIGPSLPPYQISFKVKTSENRKLIEELVISPLNRPDLSQTLSVHAMTPIKRDKEFFVGSADVNFDGYNDLFLVTSRGTANTYADYWEFEPKAKKFSYLGNYPILKVENKTKTLSSYERGGSGGMIFTQNAYKFIDGVLTIIESVKQEATDQDGVYIKKTFRRKSGTLELIGTDRITTP